MNFSFERKIPHNPLFRVYVLFVILLTASPLCKIFSQDKRGGAVIVTNLIGQVHLADENGLKIDRKVTVGSLLKEGEFAVTGKSSSLMLLFSNGTLLTVQENSKVKIRTFSQEPFEANGRKVSDLQEEPSASSLDLDLDLGTLVVKTKKLRKTSKLNIHSALGTAGIRGTEFQLSQTPEAGIQLDVTESTVAFTPPGGQPTAVTQGQGLDVSNAGQIAPRPVNPVAAQNITATNEAATQVSSEISLEVVSEAMVETEAETTTEPESKDAEETGVESQEDTPDQPEENNNEQTQEQGQEQSTEPTPAEPAPVEDSTPPVSPEVRVDEVLEQNQDAKQVRKTGNETVSSEELTKFPFDNVQLEKFLSFPKNIQEEFLLREFELVTRLLDLENFGPAEAAHFLSFTVQTQEIILQLGNSPLSSLLVQKMEEEIILNTLTPEGIDLSQSSILQKLNAPSDPLQESIFALADELRESGNSWIFDEFLKRAGGEWNNDWLEKASIANSLAQDKTLTTDFMEIDSPPGAQILANPYFTEVSSMYSRLEMDGLVAGNDPLIFGGKNVELLAGSYDFLNELGKGDTLIISAAEKLSIAGQYSLSGDSKSGNRIIVMSGGKMDISEGSSITSMLSDLVILTREDVLLRDNRLESAREVAIRSLRNASLEQVSINAGSLVRIHAERDLDVDGLQLSQTLPSLIMEATTIRLRNIDFSATTQVQLNSLKGPIDGRYPNFGTAVSPAQQLGRVNFIENVRSGGNLMNNRATFDQFGGNITIGKIPGR